MRTVAVVDATAEAEEARFRATAQGRQSVGRTMGEALDALAAQLENSEEGTFVYIQKRQPDRFFTAEQHDRMRHLFSRRNTLTKEESKELEGLVDRELDATIARAEAFLKHLAT